MVLGAPESGVVELGNLVLFGELVSCILGVPALGILECGIGVGIDARGTDEGGMLELDIPSLGMLGYIHIRVHGRVAL